MASSWQTAAALLLVALAAGYLVARAVRKRRHPGCGGGCCPGGELNAALRRRPGGRGEAPRPAARSVFSAFKAKPKR